MSDSVLPANWAEAQFDDVITFRTGYAFKSSEFKPNGVFVLRVTNISPSGSIDLDNPIFISQKDYEAKYRDFSLNDGDVVIVMVGATTGKLGRIKQEILPAVLNQNMWKLSPKYSDEVGRKFLYYYLRHIQPEVLKGAGGSATGFIKQGDFKQRKYPLPPVGEQIRIVAKIESTQEKIKTIEESVSKAEELIGKYRESLLQKAFRGQLVPQDPNDEPASDILKRIRTEQAQATDSKKKKKEDRPPISENEIPFEIPKSWEWVRFGDLTINYDGMRKPIKSSDREKRKGIYPYYGASGIIDSLDSYLFDGEFLLISEDGANLLARSTPIAFIASGKFWVNNHAHIVNATQITSNKYLELYFSSLNISKWVTGAAQPKFNQEKMNLVPVPIPPLEEQNRILQVLESKFKELVVQEKLFINILLKTEQISNSILSCAFSGTLVPQIESEGSGKELLEKISASSIENKNAEPSPGSKNHNVQLKKVKK